MYSDTIPIPSQGLFYENVGEYLEVYHLTTEDELMMTSPNLFNKGDVLYKLLERTVCKHNDIKLDDILINDKEFILLWLRENAYGHIIEHQDKDEKFYFDTNNIKIRNLSIPPDDGLFYTYVYKNEYVFKIKLLTIGDEKKLKHLKTKLDYYTSYIHSINGNEDKYYIKMFLSNQPILDGRKIKKYIDKINFGVVKETTCIVNNVPTKTNIDMNELFFGYSLDNLSKISKALNDGIFFLMNEGQGYTNNDILKMPTYYRKFNEEKLVEKIHAMNEQLKQK